MAKSKAETVKDIKAANGAEVSDTLSQKQLDELFTLAESGESGREAFDAKLTSFAPASEAPTPTSSSTRKISVRVNDTIAAYGGEFTDPENGQTIGKDAVEVEHTPFVRQLLRSDELVEAD